MNRFQEILSRDPQQSLTLINIYKELPIIHPASISDIRGNHLEVTTTELQLAAISQCNEVFIRAPEFEAPVLGKMDSIDIRRKLVWLCDFRTAQIDAERRETVRVRFQRPTSVVMHTSTDKISGVIQDISLGGCSITTLVRSGLDAANDLELDLKLMDKATGSPNCTRIPCTLIKASGDTPPFRCTFTFRHNKQTEQFLCVLINQRQLEILKELREAI